MKKKLLSILAIVTIILTLCFGMVTVEGAGQSSTEPTTATQVITIKEKTKKKIIVKKKKKRKKKSKYVKSKKYPIAAKIWNNMKKQGYSDKVCAGIMGNIMAECGGQTLNIQHKMYTGNYYGICQWSLSNHPSISGANLDRQLKLLKKTIKPEFKTFGFISGYSHKQFCKIKNEKTVALAFAKTYERCASYTYGVRKTNATKAYKYFIKHKKYIKY